MVAQVHPAQARAALSIASSLFASPQRPTGQSYGSPRRGEEDPMRLTLLGERFGAVKVVAWMGDPDAVLLIRRALDRPWVCYGRLGATVSGRGRLIDQRCRSRK